MIECAKAISAAFLDNGQLVTIYAYVTHGIFSFESEKRFDPIAQFIYTNSTTPIQKRLPRNFISIDSTPAILHGITQIFGFNVDNAPYDNGRQFKSRPPTMGGGRRLRR